MVKESNKVSITPLNTSERSKKIILELLNRLKL